MRKPESHSLYNKEMAFGKVKGDTKASNYDKLVIRLPC